MFLFKYVLRTDRDVDRRNFCIVANVNLRITGGRVAGQRSAPAGQADGQGIGTGIEFLGIDRFQVYRDRVNLRTCANVDLGTLIAFGIGV